MELKYPKDKYPRISVITVVYNRAEMIERAIKSALIQNYPNMEYLVLDAASTDGTVEIINKYHSNIDYFRSHKDSGPAAAINEGIDKSTGEIIALLNSDDFFEPNILIKVGEAFIENPNAEMVNFNVKVLIRTNSGEMKIEHVSKTEDLEFKKGQLNKLYTLGRFYKKSLYEKYGKYVETVNGKRAIANDYEHIIKLSIYGVNNVTLDTIGYTCEAHEQSLSFNTSKYTKLRVNEEKAFYLESLLKDHEQHIGAEFKAALLKEHKKAHARTVVKHIIDKNFKKAASSIANHIKKNGVLSVISIARFYISYILRK